MTKEKSMYDLNSDETVTHQTRVPTDRLFKAACAISEPHPDTLSTEHLLLAMHGVNDGLWVWDVTQEKAYYSTRWKQILGFADSEIGNDLQAWHGRIHPEDRVGFHALIKAHKQLPGSSFEIEQRLRCADGYYRWVLVRGRAFGDTNGNVCQFAGSLTDISSRKSAEQHLRHIATHDSLTGLKNRAYVMEAINSRLSQPDAAPFALALLDLDQFKRVNDSLGHNVGDQMIYIQARRLRDHVGAQNLVARLGGDEFAILFDCSDGTDAVLLSLQAALRELAQSVPTPEYVLYGSASAGIVLDSSGYTTATALLRDADTALYAAKSKGRNQYAIFDGAMREKALLHMRLEADLRMAVERNELRLHYQPIVSLETGAITSLEALLRWQHPTLGTLMPSVFMNLVLESEVAAHIDEWVITRACRDLAYWQVRFPMAAMLAVSVNLTGPRYADPSLVPMVQRALERSGLPPSSLVLEVTEAITIEQATVVAANLERLRRYGVGLCLDDFGTGYASLSHLHRLPFQMLKIDQSFVSDMEYDFQKQTIIRSVVALAQALRMHVIAEGVETADHRRRLAAVGCTFGQGYHFSHPLDAATLATMLETQQLPWQATTRRLAAIS